ncbi:DNA topoisomerase 3 [Paenibacillus sp. MBLB4367]|uniref:type IA DNA topoisomerase n=1 Tax=Paenibacillus sp. MBLB4367 TaxID=3384767 RepID=UPI0039082379
MKTLIIAEKPDMGRTIAAVIEPKAANKRTHLVGQNHIITWAIGHLVGLAEPDRYDDKYKKWNLGDLPIIPEQFKLIPNARTKDQLAVIAELAKECDSLVNACDAGREGQLIFAYIQQHLRLRQPVKRLWISDLTAETIRSGFEGLKDGAAYENLTKAARARSEADWLIGMNGSRAFTTRHNELLSVGRVQTPVLALVYDRQILIEQFTSLKFYDIEASFDQQAASYKGMWQGERLTDPQKAEAIAAKVWGKTGKIASYEVKDTKEYPWKLYDLTLLQREANGKYGFSAKKTLDLAQALYEKHKVISYPRTNSNYVNDQNIGDMHRALDALRGTSYNDLVQGAEKRFVHKNNKSICNPSKVEDHHAILPTAKKAGSLSADEQKVYDLVVRRFLSHFYPAAEYKMHTVLTEVEGETFKTNVKQLLSLGWKVVYPDQKNAAAKGKKESDEAKDKSGKPGEDEKDAVAEIETDAPFSVDPESPVLCSDAQAKEKETQPPKPFTEGTLLKAMESAGKQVEDDELREAMKDSGLGTPATRAATIERLKNVGYIVMQGKRITITAKGRLAIELIRGAGVELLTSPEMTGQWERRLTDISRGQAADDAFMEKVKKFAALIVDKVRMQSPAAKQAFAAAEQPAKRGRGSRSGAAADEGGAGKRAASGRAPRGAAAGGTRSAGGGASAGGGYAAAQRGSAGASRSGAAASTAAAAQSRVRQPAGEAGAAPAPAAPQVIAACPRPGCGGGIFMGRRGYGCSHYKNGCSFVVWKTSFGKTLTDATVRTLIEKGKTSKLKLTDANGNEVSARIVLKDAATGALELET